MQQIASKRCICYFQITMEGTIEAVIGVDVGGTNTDAVILQTNIQPPVVLSSSKSVTTHDVTSGIKSAIILAINQRNKDTDLAIQRVNIGTTHFVNAVVQRRELTKVAVIRLCGTASRKVPPFSDFPNDLTNCINGGTYFVNGGYQVDGREITPVDKQEILNIVQGSLHEGVSHFVLCGIYCSLNNDQELHVRTIIKNEFPEASVTLSHEVGQVGLLERENAAILNECLKPLCIKTISGFRSALLSMGLTCPLYLTQNDGTVINEQYALEHPVCTFASGPTNSMRGAAFLSGKKDAIVVDIGGTSTDVGILRKGFPREASTEIKIGNVRTNFRMPDVYSIGLGGGSYVKTHKDKKGLVVTVGPRSAGYNIKRDAFIFQDSIETCKMNVLTATDLAVAAGYSKLGNEYNVSQLSVEMVEAGTQKMKTMVENAIDNVKLSAEPLPVILVGGGGIILNIEKGLEGASELILPDHFDVANAVGAALSQMSGTVEYVVNLAENVSEENIQQEAISKTQNDVSYSDIEDIKKNIRKTLYEEARLMALENAVKSATKIAINTGADPDTVTVLEKSDTPLAYLPGNVTRINCKVVGDVQYSDTSPVMIGKDFPIQTPEQLVHDIQVSEEKEIEEHNENLKQRQEKPFINEKKEWVLSNYDVECIGIGAGILGCGGGGSPHLGKLLTKKALAEGKTIKIVNPHTFYANKHQSDDMVVEIAYMGAPSVIAEKLVCSEAITAMQCMKDIYVTGQYKNWDLLAQENVEIQKANGVTFIDNYTSKSDESVWTNTNLDGKKSIVGLVSFEIGGLNAMVPLIVGAELGLPLLDCDGLGRAFPELQMFCPLIYDSNPYPATLADDKGRRAVVLHADTAKGMENNFRRVVVEMGCTGFFILPPLTKDEALNKTVLFSYSRAWRLGDAVVSARIHKTDPIKAMLDEVGGLHLLSGKITDVKRETTGGFNKGFIHISGIESFSEQRLILEFQNENLIARRNFTTNTNKWEVVACVPELITIVDDDTGEPITTEMVRYGLRVSVLVLPIPDIMKTPKALEVVGPKAFGYPSDVKYKTIAEYREPVPVVD